MIKLVKVVEKEILEQNNHMLLFKVTCENIDGRKANGFCWISRNMYLDLALDLDRILLDQIEQGLIRKDEEE